ncbi:hypothetical protein D3C78_1861070 [compost metagenome]
MGGDKRGSLYPDAENRVNDTGGIGGIFHGHKSGGRASPLSADRISDHIGDYLARLKIVTKYVSSFLEGIFKCHDDWLK